MRDIVFNGDKCGIGRRLVKFIQSFDSNRRIETSIYRNGFQIIKGFRKRKLTLEQILSGRYTYV